MFEENKFNEFAKQMENEIIKHEYVYGDSWKDLEIEVLQQRLKYKFNEFNMTKNKSKLVSLCNLAMMLSVRIEREKDING